MMYTPFRHIPAVFRKAQPLHITFFVTRRCNARCPFCFYLKAADAPVGPSTELTLDEIRKISRSLNNLLWVAFSGGEIFLRDDIVEISRIFYKNNRPAIMLYPTNGMLPELIRERTEEILRICVKSVIAVKLSIDGLGTAHDSLRNTPGSFENTMRTYRLLEELISIYPHFELGVNTVFCAENQDNMDAIIDYVSGLRNVKTHTISLIRGNLADERFKDIDPQKYAAVIDKLEKNLRTGRATTYRFWGARIKAAQDILQRRFIYRTLQEKKRLIPCYAGRLNIVLTENGEVYPCELLTNSFGNVRDYAYDIKKVIQSEQAIETLASIKNGHCFCTHECYFMTNILFNPKLYPALSMEYLRV